MSKTYLEHFYNLFAFELLRVVYYTVGQYDIFLHIVHKVVDVELLLLLPMLRLFALSLSIRGGTGYFARHFKLLKLNFSQHNLVLKFLFHSALVLDFASYLLVDPYLQSLLFVKVLLDILRILNALKILIFEI